MKLSEILPVNENMAVVLGDDGGMHWQLSDAIRNMNKHASGHKNKDVRKLCTTAVQQLKSQGAQPGSIYGGDPHMLLKLLTIFRGKPDTTTLQGAVDSLEQYSQTSGE